jgi:hypothetical protein
MAFRETQSIISCTRVMVIARGTDCKSLIEVTEYCTAITDFMEYIIDFTTNWDTY